MKTIVITGSTKGIGFNLALEFLRKGHQVTINGRSEDNLNKAIIKLSEFQKNIFVFGGAGRQVTQQPYHHKQPKIELTLTGQAGDS